MYGKLLFFCFVFSAKVFAQNTFSLKDSIDLSIENESILNLPSIENKNIFNAKISTILIEKYIGKEIKVTQNKKAIKNYTIVEIYNPQYTEFYRLHPDIDTAYWFIVENENKKGIIFGFRKKIYLLPTNYDSLMIGNFYKKDIYDKQSFFYSNQSFSHLVPRNKDTFFLFYPVKGILKDSNKYFFNYQTYVPLKKDIGFKLINEIKPFPDTGIFKTKRHIEREFKFFPMVINQFELKYGDINYNAVSTDTPSINCVSFALGKNFHIGTNNERLFISNWWYLGLATTGEVRFFDGSRKLFEQKVNDKISPFMLNIKAEGGYGIAIPIIGVFAIQGQYGISYDFNRSYKNIGIGLSFYHFQLGLQRMYNKKDDILCFNGFLQINLFK